MMILICTSTMAYDYFKEGRIRSYCIVTLLFRMSLFYVYTASKVSTKPPEVIHTYFLQVQVYVTHTSTGYILTGNRLHLANSLRPASTIVATPYLLMQYQLVLILHVLCQGCVTPLPWKHMGNNSSPQVQISPAVHIYSPHGNTG